MSRPTVNPLGAHLGYWLRFVSNHVSRGFARKVEARGVSVAEWVVLRALFDESGLAPSLLAERMGMTRGAITKIVDRLGGKGLIVRRMEASDRRYQQLALTAEGRKLVPALAKLADANDAEAFGHLSRTQRDALLRALQALAEHHGLKAVPID